MIIAESAISLTSHHSYQEIYHKSESLTVWDNRKSGTNMPLGAQGDEMRSQHRTMVNQASLIELSAQALGSRRVHAPVSPVDQEDKAVADLNLRILAAMVERLTGKKIEITLPEEAMVPEGELPQTEIQTAIPEDSGQAPLQGYGMIYEYNESYRESERTSFSAQGIVRTADGQEIDFSVKLNMSREFIAEKSISIRAGDALKDPLMLNFSGTAADISAREYTFDIDSDGRSEQISFAGPQSGFLAYDKNGDGRINNGSELFGPKTGDGFEELAAYDSDGNNWIDENDNIYENLRIWMKTDSGENQLFALGEKGVGAIYLNHIATPFLLKDSSNQLLGQVQSSGIFLQEGGGVGTIQQIDLAA